MNFDDAVFSCVECDFALPVGVGVVSIDLTTGEVSDDKSFADAIDDEDLPSCPECGAETVVAIDEGGG